VLLVQIPKVCIREQHYILDIMIGEFLGLPFRVEEYDKSNINIRRPGSSSSISLNADFFHRAHKEWLGKSTMPVLPMKFWVPVSHRFNRKLAEISVPVIYGQAGMEENYNCIHMNLDIFGSSFFMLTRYEELITPERDEHDRFPASSSVAYNAGFLDKPVVNQYLDILWACIQTLWPDMERKERKFRKLISCDIDQPFDLAGRSLKRTLLRVCARLIRDHNPELVIRDGLNYIFKRFGSDYFDEYRRNIDWIMTVNQKAGNKVAFYFIPIQTDTQFDNVDDIRTGKNQDLLRQIAGAGHEIGFHPGYETYHCSEKFTQSAQALREACRNLNIDIASMGGRQHYMRYDIARTPDYWQENGFIYDSTLGYPDKPGFRAGVCYEYTMYSLVRRKKMNLRQRPLIIMEASILSDEFEGLGFTHLAMERFDYFKNKCKEHSGDFTLLWHNSFFHKKSSKSFYVNVIK